MTKQEKLWQAKVRDLGCIACFVQTGIKGTPCCVHHLTDTGRRVDEMHTIGLCNPGHHKDPQPGSGKVPFHHNKRNFTEAYGSEQELWELTKKIIGT